MATITENGAQRPTYARSERQRDQEIRTRIRDEHETANAVGKPTQELERQTASIREAHEIGASVTKCTEDVVEVRGGNRSGVLRQVGVALEFGPTGTHAGERHARPQAGMRRRSQRRRNGS